MKIIKKIRYFISDLFKQTVRVLSDIFKVDNNNNNINNIIICKDTILTIPFGIWFYIGCMVISHCINIGTEEMLNARMDLVAQHLDHIEQILFNQQPGIGVREE